MGFTTDQLKAIHLKERNLLVSAAAGSGKTAVLVERIIQLVTNIDNPIDLDQLLVVTFTSAAASEMRERIGDALEKELEKAPENNHLQRQLVLLSCSNIMTVHAFCMKVIKSYYHQIGLDPSFRIGDENELELIKKDVLGDLLEEKYEQGDQTFIDFIESYSGQKTDEQIEELILKAHRFSISNPWPKDWLQGQAERLNIQSPQELEQTTFYLLMHQSITESLSVSLQLLEGAKQICNLTDGPTHYSEAICHYQNEIQLIQQKIDLGYEELKRAFDGFEVIRLSTKRTGFDPRLKEKAKAKIDRSKELIQKIKDQYFMSPVQEVVTDISGTYQVIKTLTELTIDFSLLYRKAKEEKGLIDFNDIEHFALNILIEKSEEGLLVPTEAAISYQNYFYEILIDEYQDSNMVQETILNAISKERMGQPNIFMVGDIKQSIYKFRLARPELFLKKYEQYSEENSLFQKIDLHQNFRSRTEVVESINYIFSQLMSSQLGDVEYDHRAALYVGAAYDQNEGCDYDTELLLLYQRDTQSELEEELKETIERKPSELDEEDSDESETKDDNHKTFEAKLIAKRIKELVHPNSNMLVYDKKQGKSRPITYKDIVILLRTTSKTAEIYQETLQNQGVPVYYDTKSGYFDTLEIRIILNYMQLIDNPRQDLPLAAVLHSPILGLSGEELAIIRSHNLEGEMYQAVLLYIEASFQENILSQKLSKFVDQLNDFRKMSKYLPMDELIYLIYDKTNYYHYMSFMPNGQRRQANLDMLVDRAVAYEKSSYRGVFNFIRYIENIKKYAMDLGEASTLTENDNLVKIMSIHRSKGLEFPVVFVAGLEKRFNKQDLNQMVVFHPELGMASDYIDYENRFRVGTLPKSMIKEKLNEELLSEELRILYVALTRAREKLILVGWTNSLESQIEKWSFPLSESEMTLNVHDLRRGRSPLDWIASACIRHIDAKVLREQIDAEALSGFTNHDPGFNLKISLIPSSEVDEKAAVEAEEYDLDRLLEDWKSLPVSQEHKNLDNLNWVYPYQNLVNAKVQMSVSDIKRIHMEETEDLPKLPIIPSFVSKKDGLTSAEKGTVYHKIMSFLPMTPRIPLESIEEFLEGMVQQQIITAEDRRSVDSRAFVRFLKSPLAERMHQASMNLQREKPFIMGIKISEMLDSEKESNEIVMVQGVIDAFFEEEGELVLVDYKTDYIEKGNEDLLEVRYKEQMFYYKKALEQITGLKVKECMIYPLLA